MSKRGDHRRFVDNRPPSRVEEDGTRLHPRKLGGADHPSGLLR
jgi:hypothetical protein